MHKIRVDSEITIFLAQLRCCASIDERTVRLPVPGLVQFRVT